jgi:acetyltransferase-like isoleucine patch superfamily enzyme
MRAPLLLRASCRLGTTLRAPPATGVNGSAPWHADAEAGTRSVGAMARALSSSVAGVASGAWKPARANGSWTCAHQRPVRSSRRCRAPSPVEALNRLPYADQDAIRAAWAELTSSEPDLTFRLIPPVYSDQGINIRVGRDVFINHNCTLNDIGGITIGDGVFIGPRVSLISPGHPIDPARRRSHITAGPIVIERGVWLCAGATVLQGVTVGEDTVVTAGAVVTSDVPAGVVAGGVPAKVLRPVAADDRA